MDRAETEQLINDARDLLVDAVPWMCQMVADIPVVLHDDPTPRTRHYTSRDGVITLNPLRLEFKGVRHRAQRVAYTASTLLVAYYRILARVDERVHDDATLGDDAGAYDVAATAEMVTKVTMTGVHGRPGLTFPIPPGAKTTGQLLASARYRRELFDGKILRHGVLEQIFETPWSSGINPSTQLPYSGDDTLAQLRSERLFIRDTANDAEEYLDALTRIENNKTLRRRYRKYRERAKLVPKPSTLAVFDFDGFGSSYRRDKFIKKVDHPIGLSGGIVDSEWLRKQVKKMNFGTGWMTSRPEKDDDTDTTEVPPPSSSRNDDDTADGTPGENPNTDTDTSNRDGETDTGSAGKTTDTTETSSPDGNDPPAVGTSLEPPTIPDRIGRRTDTDAQRLDTLRDEVFALKNDQANVPAFANEFAFQRGTPVLRVDKVFHRDFNKMLAGMSAKRTQRTYKRPNRRLHQVEADTGLIFPGRIGQNRNLTIAIDVSASVGDAYISNALTEIGRIALAGDFTVRYFAVSHRAYTVRQLNPSTPIILERDRGNTDMRAAFDTFAAEGAKNCVIITDMRAYWPAEPPDPTAEYALVWMEPSFASQREQRRELLNQGVDLGDDYDFQPYCPDWATFLRLPRTDNGW